MNVINVIFIIISVIWYLGCILFILYLNKKYNRPYLTEFNEKYYNDIPSQLNPCQLSYLLYKKLVLEVLSATVQFLIIKERLIVKKQENDFIIYGNYNDKKMSKSQKYLCDFLINTIGDTKYVKLSDINNYCNNNGGASEFLLNYQIWKKIITKESKNNYYEEKTEFSYIRKYQFIGLCIFALNIIFSFNYTASFFIPFFAFFLSFYFFKIFKRTKEANTEYYKWLAFRNYLKDSNFQENISKLDKQKYLLYATIYKIDDKVAPKLGEDNFVSLLTSSLNNAVIKATLYGNRSIFKK